VPGLPWTSRAELEPGSEYLVMASHLPLSRISAADGRPIMAGALKRT